MGNLKYIANRKFYCPGKKQKKIIRITNLRTFLNKK